MPGNIDEGADTVGKGLVELIDPDNGIVVRLEIHCNPPADLTRGILIRHAAASADA
jgi:hypothetical protein